MAACSLFEEDEVCHVTPDNIYIYGLVMENSESVSSDEEDSRQDICKKGCVRIAWHPRGKESYNTPENRVQLADRTLMVADVVRRFVPGQETQCGTVQDLQITCHLQVTGTDKYIYDVDSKLLSPCVQIQRFENGYVTMNNWLGRVEEVAENITLVLPDGARCDVVDSDVSYLEDISEKRPETATFSEEYWYPGQQLRGELGSLCNATWHHTTLLHNSKNVDNKKNSTFYAVVESVKVRCIYVYWICCGYSKVTTPTTSESMPPLKIEGDDIEKLQLVDWFEHCTVKLGDKMYYTIREEDVLETQQPKHRFVPHAVQQASSQRLAEITHRTESLYRQQFNETHKYHHKGSKKGAASASSSNATATTVASSVSTNSLPEGAVAMETNSKTTEMEAKGLQIAVEKGAGDLEADADADADADDEYEDIDEKQNDGESDDDGSLSSSTSGTKRRKRDRGVSISIKSLRKASRQARRTRTVAEISTKPGSRVATEVCYTFTLVTVTWQDGTVEKDIPSVELFPIHHMDELEYFPGTFVVDTAASATSSEYGVVTSCNRFERTCQVKWFKPYEVGQSTFPTEVIREAEVSVYDIHDHPDFKFRPGNSVIRVAGFEDTQQTLQAVGQVLRLDPSGSVFVRWSDGSFTSSYPQDLYIVLDMSDYSNSSSEVESSSSDGYESSESSDSWETEEEEWKKVDDAGGDDIDNLSEEEVYNSEKDVDEKTLKFKDMDEQRASEIKRLMGRITNCFDEISEKYFSVMCRTPDVFNNVTIVNSVMLPSLKRVLKAFRAWHKFDKEIKASFTGNNHDTSVIHKMISAIKYDIKRVKTNKIKQHLAHVFESTNKGLLEQDKDVKRTEIATDTSDLQVSQGAVADDPMMDSSLATGSPSKKIKTEMGTSVAVDFGSSVDDVCEPSITTCGPVENGIPSGVQDIEKDISCRLAATNVFESKDWSGVANEIKDLDDVLPTAVNDEGQLSLDEYKKESTKWAWFLEPVRVKLVFIQEYMSEMEKVARSDWKRTTELADLAQGKASEEKAEKGQKESQVVDSSCSCALTEGKECKEEVVLPAGAEVDVRQDNVEGCDVPPGSSVDSKSPMLMNGIKDDSEDDEGDIADPPGMALPQGFFMCGAAPDCHSYFAKTYMPSNPQKFNSAIRKELKLLRSSLPHGIIIKGFEDRMDLFSVLIDGPIDTPYEDGMFLFDVMLPHDYPVSPPLFHYLSFAPDRLNPNLYVDGKVCVSLLGTWSGKGMEVWTVHSNLLQVLVSIQGLILVDEPYYNEAGYEKQRGQQIALENSRMYNEMALLKLVEGMSAMCDDPPKPFVHEVRERLQSNGPRMIARLRRWMSLSESMGERQHLVTASKANNSAEGGAGVESTTHNPSDCSTTNCAASATEDLSFSAETSTLASQGQACQKSFPPGHPHFPLLPMSKGFRLTLQKSLSRFEAAIHKLQTLRESEGAAENMEASSEQSEAAFQS